MGRRVDLRVDMVRDEEVVGMGVVVGVAKRLWAIAVGADVAEVG